MFVALHNADWIACQRRYDALNNFCKRIFWHFYSLKKKMLDAEENARSRFISLSSKQWLAALLDLTELKATPKRAGAHMPVARQVALQALICTLLFSF